MSKKIRFFFLYLSYYIRKYALIMVFGASFGSAIFYFRKSIVSGYQQLFPPTFQIGLEGLYTQSNLPPIISQKISYGLTAIVDNDKVNLSPLVDDLSTDNDHLRYTITLKPNQTWQNGQALRASDTNINIPNLTITYQNPLTIVIDLQEPYSPLLSALSKPIFLRKTLIGLADYQVDNITFQDGYVKTIDLTSDQKPKLSYHFYQSSQDILQAYKLGEIDEMVTSILDPSLTSWPSTKVTPNISTKQYLAIFLNTTKISDKQVRQALAYATPKTDTYNQRCLGPISPQSWAYNPEVKPYHFNPTRAKELIKDNHLAEINLIVTDRNLLDQAEKISRSWQDILQTKVNITTSNQDINLQDYQAVLTYGPIPTDPDQYQYWHSTQTNTNITHLNNQRIDKLLEEGRQTFDQLERKKNYNDFQKFLLEESPAIFLEFPSNYTITRIK